MSFQKALNRGKDKPVMKRVGLEVFSRRRFGRISKDTAPVAQGNHHT